MKAYYVEKSKEGSPTLFSLYTTGKPEELDTDKNDKQLVRFKNWQKENLPRLLKQHFDSHHAYLRELEFKVGDIVKRNYPDTTSGYMVGTLIEIYVGDKPTTLTCQNGSTRIGILKEHATHYYPGQEIEASKVSYVREVVSNINACGDDEWLEMSKVIYEWQPAPEPEKWLKENDSSGHVGDIASGIAQAARTAFNTPNPNYDKWLSDRSGGKVQAIIKLNK